MNGHAALTLLTGATFALSGCTADDLSTATRSTPSSTAGQWNAGLEVSSFHVSGKATFTYADGTTRTVRFSGDEDEITDTSMVLIGQSVSIAVRVTESTGGHPRSASCMIFEADYELLGEGKMPMVIKVGHKGDAFTCTWTNDGTLTTPKPEI